METKNKKFPELFPEIGKKIRTKQILFGNSTSEFAVSFNNLNKIEKGSIGIVTDVSVDPEVNVWFFTVRFAGGIFVNINQSTFDFVE
jgi:hypothetical protein